MAWSSETNGDVSSLGGWWTGMSPFMRSLLLFVWTAVGLALTFMACGTIPNDDAAPAGPATPIESDVPTTAGPENTATTDATSGESSTTQPPTTAASTTEAPTTTATPPPDTREAPIDAVSLTAELSEAELMIRSSEVDAVEVGAWGRRQQELYRVLSANPGWGPEVVAGVADEVRPAVEENWAARQNLSSLVSSVRLSSTLPAWKITEPLPADVLVGYYKEAEAETGIPWEYIAAINLIETRMGRIQGLSTAGATGPMQFLPSTFAECCEGDPNVERDAIIGAAVYLDIRGGPENMRQAVQGYNNSGRYVSAVESYAAVLEQDESAYRGYHAWEVYFLSSAGLLRIPAGYEEPEPVDAAAWVGENPTALVN